jgi:flagellar biosynthesis protein FliR
MLVTLLFLSMNGHLVVFEVLTESFTTLPVGGGLLTLHFWEVVGKLGWVLGAALMLVLPAITALLVVNIAFGVMTRAAPQLNIFAIGFPLTLVLGMGIFWIGLADILNQYQPLASDALQFYVIWHGRAEPWPRARVVRTKQKTPRRNVKKTPGKRARSPVPKSSIPWR